MKIVGVLQFADVAGLFIVIMITLSALLAGYESIRRFFEPQPVANLRGC
jgi:divalent metal cation (Fe/Co/Zn/Cd) transporter